MYQEYEEIRTSAIKKRLLKKIYSESNRKQRLDQSAGQVNIVTKK